MGLGNSGESCDSGDLLILLILVIMGIIVILVHKFLYCGVRSKTSQELRTLSLSQAIHNHKVILNNVVLNCQQCNQCLKCHKISKNLCNQCLKCHMKSVFQV